MMLLTAVTFGGSESVNSLEFLPDDEADLLKHRAHELLQIPREKRIPLLVQEIKRLVNARKGQLWAADPVKLAEVLKHERPVLVEVLLKAFPVVLAEAVRAQLPPLRARMIRDPRPEVLGLLRWKLEEVLTKMGSPHAHFKFSDVLRLQSRELLTLVDTVGAKGLGPAAAGMPDADREALLQALSPDHRQLLQKAVVSSIDAGRRLEEKDARENLEPHGLNTAAAGMVRSAGIQRLARACLAQGSEFAALLVEKYPGELGRLIAKWVREERTRAVNRGDGGRAEFVEEMERLEGMGLVTKPVRLAPAPKQAAPNAPAAGAGAGKGWVAPPGATGPKNPPPSAGRGPQFGGAAAAPRASPPKPGLGVPGQRIDPTRERNAGNAGSKPPLPAPSPKRDWVAERRARLAGAAPSQQHEVVKRDLIAERNMRKAGMGPINSQGPMPEGKRPTGARSAQSAGNKPEVTAPIADNPPRRAMTSPTTVKPPALKKASGDYPAAGSSNAGKSNAAGTNVARPPRVSGEFKMPSKIGPGGGPGGNPGGSKDGK